MQPVKAAGGVVFKPDQQEPEVILIFRRGVWDLPKGKLDDGESIKDCATREVSEEIGLSESPQIVDKLIETYHEYHQNGTHYGKTTHWYAMQLSDPSKVSFTPETQEGIEKVRWYPLVEAKQLVGFDNLVDVLNTLDALNNS